MRKREPEDIRKPMDKNKVYQVFLEQLNMIERSTISVDQADQDRARENSLDIGFKLFPIIESVALNIVGKTTRAYLKELGYSKIEANLMYSMFRNGLLHNFNPFHYVYDDGEISWGLMSSSGSGGFVPYFPGYKSDDAEYNVPADKAFTYEKIGQGQVHASLSLDGLLSHVRYDLNERLKKDTRTKIDIVVGKRFFEKIPSVR
ncbi:MAG: hypothetical protein WCO78_04630 [Candidatus Roizmanbacteria bacterium]